MSFAAAMRSSDVRALGDDARKDDENVAFLAARPLAEQAEWLARLRWIRLADRLAENELFDPSTRRFATFCAEWRAVREGGEPAGEHASTWREMRACWWSPSGAAREPQAIAAFAEYLDALGDYTVRGLAIRTLAEHDRMCRRMSGSLFQVFPYLEDEQRDAAADLGTLDQMMNNVRDLAEDASHGLCFLPLELLARFGVTLDSLLDGSAVADPSYRAMMRFWVYGHLAIVRERAAAFVTLPGLHPSLAAMGNACLARYARIVRVLRTCDFDYLAFARAYWDSPPRVPSVA